MVKHTAFTLIELVFAIVIIAISVVSLPMMNQAISKGIDSNLVQEAIFASSTQLSEALGSHWDENSLEPGEPFSLARVIDLGPVACINDNTLSTFRQLRGHINQPLHRRCLNNPGTTPSAVDVANVISLDDMIDDRDLFSNNAHAKGYKEAYTTALTVTRPSNFNGNNNNIKQLEVTVKDSDGNIVTKLKTYSANIGEVDYYKRTY